MRIRMRRTFPLPGPFYVSPGSKRRRSRGKASSGTGCLSVLGLGGIFALYNWNIIAGITVTVLAVIFTGLYLAGKAAEKERGSQVKRNMAGLTVAGLALAGVAACGVQGAAAAPSRPGPVQTASPAQTAPAVQLSRAQMRQECAALAMVKSGMDTYANQVNVMAGQYSVDRHEAAGLIRQAVNGYCPSEISVLP